MCRSRLPQAERRRRPEGRGTQSRVIHRASDGFGGSASEFTSGSRPLNKARAFPELDSGMDLFNVALKGEDAREPSYGTMELKALRLASPCWRYSLAFMHTN
jgi:hypothetical protein